MSAFSMHRGKQTRFDPGDVPAAETPLIFSDPIFSAPQKVKDVSWDDFARLSPAPAAAPGDTWAYTVHPKENSSTVGSLSPP